MLTKQQQDKLNVMVAKYRIAMLVKHKASPEQISAWGLRYRIAMEQVLQRRCKH